MSDILDRLLSSTNPLCNEAGEEIKEMRERFINLDMEVARQTQTLSARIKVLTGQLSEKDTELSKLKRDLAQAQEEDTPPRPTYRELRQASKERRG